MKQENKSYALYINNAGGSYEIIEYELWEEIPRDRPYHYSLVDVFKTEEDAKAYVEEIKKETTCYAVFYDSARGEGFVSEEDDLSGNWQGSKYGYSTYMGNYGTEEEALEELRKIYKEHGIEISDDEAVDEG